MCKSGFVKTVIAAVSILAAVLVQFGPLAGVASAAPGEYSWEDYIRPTHSGGDNIGTAFAKDGRIIEHYLNGTTGEYTNYVSSDKGISWSKHKTGTLVTAGQDDEIKVDRTFSSDKISICKTNRLSQEPWTVTKQQFISNDFGATWRKINDSGCYNISEDGSKFYYVKDDYFYVSSDDGVSFKSNKIPGRNPYSWAERYPLTSSPNGDVFLFESGDYSANDKAWFLTTDGGNTWKQLEEDLYANGGSIYMFLNNSGEIIKVPYDEGKMRGNSFATFASGDRSVFVNGRGRAYSNNPGYVYVTRDYGENWIAMGEEGGSNLDSWPTVYISYDGSVVIGAKHKSDGTVKIGRYEGPATTTAPVSNPSENADSSITQASLSATSLTCYTLDTSSVKALPAAGVAAPDGIEVLGGLSFRVNCARAGGSSDLKIQLGTQIADLSKLHIYKKYSSGEFEEITGKVSVRNENIDGKLATIVAYKAVDGADFDDDKTENSAIVDPIYFGVESENNGGTTDNTETSAANQTGGEAAAGELAQTGASWLALAAVGSLALLGGAAILRRRAAK